MAKTRKSKAEKAVEPSESIQESNETDVDAAETEIADEAVEAEAEPPVDSDGAGDEVAAVAPADEISGEFEALTGEDDPEADLDVSPDLEAQEAIEAEPEVAEEDPEPEVADEDPEPEVSAEATEPAPTAEPRPAETRQRSGFFPLAIGGLAAGLIGYGAAWYQSQQGDDPTAGLIERLAAVETVAADATAAVAGIGETDLSGVESDLTGLSEAVAALSERLDLINAETTGTLSGLSGVVEDLEARMTDLEQRPTGDGSTLADEAIAAYEREVGQLRADMQAQAEQLRTMTTEAEEQLQQARQEILDAEAAAEEAARASEARAALGRVLAAAETGAPFDIALGDLSSVSDADVPAVLSTVAAEGIPTEADLQASFDDVARLALSAARDEGVDDESGGMGGFFRSTFNVRSVEPREGSSPDAVLSRVNAAVEDGRINDALAEADTLPEVVRGAMSDWLNAAQSRSEALSALEVLSQVINES